MGVDREPPWKAMSNMSAAGLFGSRYVLLITN